MELVCSSYNQSHRQIQNVRDVISNGFFKQMFPENIQVSVKVKGKKQKGVKLNLYGSRAKFNDLIATPYRTYETDKKGEYLITGVPQLI